MRDVFPEHGIDFEVLYMAWSEPDRHWHFESSDLRYPSRVFRGMHPTAGGVKLHFNPALLAYVWRSRPDVLVVGGISAPTLLLAPFLFRRRAVLLLASESNPDSTRRQGGLVGLLKRNVVERYRGFITPGGTSPAYSKDIDKSAAGKPFLTLPNLIDETVFVDDVAKLRSRRSQLRGALAVGEATQLWVCPARLEPFKGLGALIDLFDKIEGVELLIAGEGSLRSQLEATIRERSLPVRLLGYRSQTEMAELYAAADVFVLPSLRDPSPLSPVEAIASGLPLFLSSRAGNREDVLISGENGWVYDPSRPASNVQAGREIAETSRERLLAMGKVSSDRFAERFNSRRRIQELAQSIIALHEG